MDCKFMCNTKAAKILCAALGVFLLLWAFCGWVSEIREIRSQGEQMRSEGEAFIDSITNDENAECHWLGQCDVRAQQVPTTHWPSQWHPLASDFVPTHSYRAFMFDICFVDTWSPNSSDKGPIAVGEISIGDFHEGFESTLTFWSKSDYERQWLDGIRRASEKGLDSCLMVSQYDPREANFLECWLLYIESDVCIFRNQLLLLDQLALPFSLLDPYSSIPPYEKYTEGGEEISEWRLSTNELGEWLNRLAS